MYSSIHLSSRWWKCFEEVLLNSSEKIAIFVSSITRGLVVALLVRMRERLILMTWSISSEPSSNIESVSFKVKDLVSPSIIMLNSTCSSFLLREPPTVCQRSRSLGLDLAYSYCHESEVDCGTSRTTSWSNNCLFLLCGLRCSAWRNHWCCCYCCRSQFRSSFHAGQTCRVAKCCQLRDYCIWYFRLECFHSSWNRLFSFSAGTHHHWPCPISTCSLGKSNLLSRLGSKGFLPKSPSEGLSDISIFLH